MPSLDPGAIRPAEPARRARRTSYPDCLFHFVPPERPGPWPSDRVVIAAAVDPAEWPAWTDEPIPFAPAPGAGLDHDTREPGAELPLFRKKRSDR